MNELLEKMEGDATTRFVLISNFQNRKMTKPIITINRLFTLVLRRSGFDFPGGRTTSDEYFYNVCNFRYTTCPRELHPCLPLNLEGLILTDFSDSFFPVTLSDLPVWWCSFLAWNHKIVGFPLMVNFLRSFLKRSKSGWKWILKLDLLMPFLNLLMPHSKESQVTDLNLQMPIPWAQIHV